MAEMHSCNYIGHSYLWYLLKLSGNFVTIRESTMTSFKNWFLCSLSLF